MIPSVAIPSLYVCGIFDMLILFYDGFLPRNKADVILLDPDPYFETFQVEYARVEFAQVEYAQVENVISITIELRNFLLFLPSLAFFELFQTDDYQDDALLNQFVTPVFTCVEYVRSLFEEFLYDWESM